MLLQIALVVVELEDVRRGALGLCGRRASRGKESELERDTEGHEEPQDYFGS